MEYRSLLVGTDLSALSRLGIDAGLALATRVHAERVHVGVVVPVPPAYLSTYVSPLPVPGSTVQPTLSRLVEDLGRLTERLGSRFTPCQALQDQARSGGKFYS